MQITSASNSRFRFWSTLAKDAAARRQSGQVLIDGDHLIEAWGLAHGPPEVMLVNMDRPDALVRLAQLTQAWSKARSFETFLLPERLLKQLFEHASPTALAGIVNVPKPVVGDLGASDVVYLDRVQDPGNLGTIMRGASAAGIAHLVTSPGCAQVWSPKVLRAAMGAHFLLSVYEGIELADIEHRVPTRILATRLDRAASLYTLDLKAACVWVFGSEGQGVSAQTQSVGQSIGVFIPQQAAQDSLNVAMAATVCLFEQKRQRLAQGG
jgi:RNA methyltransferase, TrmH family